MVGRVWLSGFFAWLGSAGAARAMVLMGLGLYEQSHLLFSMCVESASSPVMSFRLTPRSVICVGNSLIY